MTLLKKVLLSSIAILLFSCSADNKIDRLEKQAENVTIIRDNYGVPHIYGKTDADAVFGLLYAQCEDDFNRIETNYLTAMGRLAEGKGETAIYSDLRNRLFTDLDVVKQEYENSPEWLKELMIAFADGINYYLQKHPEVKPMVLTHFEPWMALTFSEGSIGGDIESASLRMISDFYGDKTLAQYIEPRASIDPEPRGSNGFAIAPELSKSGNALLLINPHTSFFFRPEVHVISEEGLNAYGAVTWGQFFVYQGFNEQCGWMHTSSKADVKDSYLETVELRDGKYYYKHGEQFKPVKERKISLKYRDGDQLKEKEFTTYSTHHGPVIGKRDDKWVTFSIMVEHETALIQSFVRTKANGYKEYDEAMDLRANSSNNTVFADNRGNIAYYHGDFIPKRDPNIDFSGYIDGSDPATDWQGLHDVDEIVTIHNPQNGWIQNCNSTPFTASAEFSPKRENYPAYMAPDLENPRGIHAVEVLSDAKDLDLDKLLALAYDSHLPAFDNLIPALIKAYDKESKSYSFMKEAIELLREWDMRYSIESVPTTLAVYWGQNMRSAFRTIKDNNHDGTYDYLISATTDIEKLEQFKATMDTLTSHFGSWQTAWGDVNRYQRINGDIEQPFNDNLPSIPVAFASSKWGSLAAFGSKTYNTKKMYGTRGNSFVAVVEFGERVKAKSILAGGQSGDPESPHFDDQAQMYADGIFKDVLFYKDDITKNMESTYHPGEER